MSRINDQLPPRGRQRPHSFDIGLQERQGHQSTSKRRGVYKSGTGTFMFQSTSMSAALDNLQFYPKVKHVDGFAAPLKVSPASSSQGCSDQCLRCSCTSCNTKQKSCANHSRLFPSVVFWVLTLSLCFTPGNCRSADLRAPSHHPRDCHHPTGPPPKLPQGPLHPRHRP